MVENNATLLRSPGLATPCPVTATVVCNAGLGGLLVPLHAVTASSKHAEIVGIVKQMEDEMSADLTAAIDAGAATVMAHAEFVAAKKKDVDAPTNDCAEA